MKKFFSLFAALFVALAMNAAVVQVSAGSGTLTAAITNAAAGDVLELADGTYTENGDYSINKNITIKAADGANPVISHLYYFKVDGGAAVTFQGIEFDGSGASDHCIRAHNNSTGAEVLTLENCVFHNYPSYVLYTQRSARKWHGLIIKNCKFYANTKYAIAVLNDSGHSCDSLVVENSTFENTTGSYSAIYVQDGNTTNVAVDHCTFYNFGGAFVKTGASVTNSTVTNCIFAQPTAGTKTPIECAGTISNCLIFNTADLPSTATACLNADPLFTNAAAGDFTLGTGSPALTAATDGGAIGDPRWAPAVAPIEPEYRTIYCKIESDWWKYDANGQPVNTVGAYAWGQGIAELAAWPGVKMDAVEGEANVWSISLDTRYANIVFTRVGPSGNYEGIKTPDLVIPADSNAMYTISAPTPDWSSPNHEMLAESDGAWSTYAPYEPALVNGYYLMGIVGGDSTATWTIADLNSSRKLEVNQANTAEYQISVTLAVGDQLQVVEVANDAITNWFPGGEGMNFVIDAAHAGEKTIYFRPDRQGASDWWQGCIYIAPNESSAIDALGADAKAVKVIENGRIYIIRDGVRFNILGAQE